MMSFFIFLGGAVFGFILASVFSFKFKSFGILEIDHGNELVAIKLKSDDFKTTKKKLVMLKVNHKANLSQK